MKTVLAFVLAALGSVASAQDFNDFAQVTNVSPMYEKVNQPREQCWNETRDVPVHNSDSHNLGGALIGGVVGGLLGNQVGGGHGREAATAVGAVAGALVGQNIEGQNNGGSYQTRTVQKCKQVDNWQEQLTGYNVSYQYRGHSFQTVMQNDPGDRLPVRVDVSPR